MVMACETYQQSAIDHLPSVIVVRRRFNVSDHGYVWTKRIGTVRHTTEVLGAHVQCEAAGSGLRREEEGDQAVYARNTMRWRTLSTMITLKVRGKDISTSGNLWKDFSLFDAFPENR